MGRIKTHLCLFITLLSLSACHQENSSALVFSEDLPDGVPDTSNGDPIFEDSTDKVIRNVHSRSVSGNDPIASLMVVEGICPDTDEPCPFSLLYYSAYRRNGDTQEVDWVVRWLLRGGGERAEGVSYMKRSAENIYVRTFWLRNDDIWERFEKGSPVATKLSRFTHDLLSYIQFLEATKPIAPPPQ